MKNGTFIVRSTITKVGTMKFMQGVPNGIKVTINNIAFLTYELDTLDFPKYIELTPGPCSATVKHNKFINNYPDNVLKAGSKINFDIDCHD